MRLHTGSLRTKIQKMQNLPYPFFSIIACNNFFNSFIYGQRFSQGFLLQFVCSVRTFTVITIFLLACSPIFMSMDDLTSYILWIIYIVGICKGHTGGNDTNKNHQGNCVGICKPGSKLKVTGKVAAIISHIVFGKKK